MDVFRSWSCTFETKGVEGVLKQFKVMHIQDDKVYILCCRLKALFKKHGSSNNTNFKFFSFRSPLQEVINFFKKALDFFYTRYHRYSLSLISIPYISAFSLISSKVGYPLILFPCKTSFRFSTISCLRTSILLQTYSRKVQGI